MSYWYYPAGVQGTVLGIAVDFERPALLSLLVHWVLTERASPVGWSQSAPTAPVGEEL